MKNIVVLILITILATANANAQSYECDNNFGDCGTPNQSGGGGGGGGSVLIANTDLGDTYQNADDYDDDGVEDPSDNCMRVSNPYQYDRDGDGIGDACDNCLDNFNPKQINSDWDDLGDACDDDDDGDGVSDSLDTCPNTWGSDCEQKKVRFNPPNLENQYNVDSTYSFEEVDSRQSEDFGEKNSCQTCNISYNISIMLIITLLYYKRSRV